MPNYLSFVKGVVDSEDLPLNISQKLFNKTRSFELLTRTLSRRAWKCLTSLQRTKRTTRSFTMPSASRSNSESMKTTRTETSLLSSCDTAVPLLGIQEPH